MLNLFKKKEKQVDTELENIQMIPVPDIRAYMLKGYEEIKGVKEQNEKLLEEKINFENEANKNKQLYEAQLIVSQEFENRCRKLDKDLDWEKSKRKDENEKRQADIDLNLQRIDKLKEEKYILEEKLKNIKKYQEEEYKSRLKEYKNKLIVEIANTKGRISKDIIINLIKEDLVEKV